MTTTEIILTALLSAASLAAVYFYLTRRKAAQRAVLSSGEDLKRQIRFSSDEVLRYKTLYEQAVLEDAKPVSLPVQADEISTDGIFKTAERVIIEQQKLEREKEEIAQRNRKLWDMSLLIQKEKEHIEYLKNDIEEKHHSVTDSISYARRIQRAVLPDRAVLRRCFSDYFIFWRPRDIVSGDFYWMKQSGDVVAFTVADCTGHGVPGAFMSLLGVTFLNEICADLNEATQPSDVLETLRTDIISALSQDSTLGQQDDGMDMAFCILNLRTKKLRFAGANNPMYLIRNGGLQELKPVKNPIGSYVFIRPFETFETDVESGDWIYMFSDGYADQFSSSTGRKFTYKRLRTLLTDLSGETGDFQNREIGRYIDNWMGSFIQLDDMMLAGYKVK